MITRCNKPVHASVFFRSWRDEQGSPINGLILMTGHPASSSVKAGSNCRIRFERGGKPHSPAARCVNDLTVNTLLLKELGKLLSNDHDPVAAMPANHTNLECRHICLSIIQDVWVASTPNYQVEATFDIQFVG
jgi:hypothetical protein